MNWAPTGESACGPAPGTGFVVLTFAPTRIRLIQMRRVWQRAIRNASSNRCLTSGNRFRQRYMPSGAPDATPNQQEFKIDSGKPVTRVLIGIGSAYPAANGQPLISLTEVILKAYPS